MGFRVQRSIGLGKFLRLNISKSGFGISAGVPGLKISTGPRGSFINLGLPGTGLSYRKKISKKTLGDFNPLRGSDGPEPVKAQTVPQKTAEPAEASALPEPGFFASRTEKAIFRALEEYRAGNFEAALENFLAATDDDAGAAIFAAALLAQKDITDYRPIALLEQVIQSDDEFPTELMEKYLADSTINITVTPTITVTVAVDGLAATLLLVELYQAQRRVREAIALLEEVVALNPDPVLVLSLCELYASRNLWEAIIDLSKDIEPNNDITFQIRTFYGQAMLGQNLPDAAVAVFNSQLRHKRSKDAPLVQEVTYWRAIAYQQQGKSRRAYEEFQKIYAFNPDYKDVKVRLDNFAIRS